MTTTGAANPISRVRSRFHTQDLGDSCGAAVAMTLLEAAGIPSDLLDQGIELSNAKQKAVGTFAMTPDALAELLNGRLALAGKSDTFQVSLFNNADACLLHLLGGAESGWPAATLLFGYHWGVIDGYEVDASGRCLSAVWIHTPIVNPEGEEDGVPPHSSYDTCGSGGALGPKDESLGFPELSSSYLVRCDELSKHFGADFVCISRLSSSPTSVLLPKECVPQVGPEEGATDLASRAARAFQDYGARLKETLEGESLSVRSIDDRYPSYDLVALGSAAGREFWVKVRGDARIPLGLACEAAPQPPVVTLAAAREVAEALRPGVLVSEVSEHFVWRPCPESFSPYLPFREITMSDEVRVYVRSDGRGFPELSSATPGG